MASPSNQSVSSCGNLNLPYGYLGGKGIKVVYRGHTMRDMGLVNGRVYDVWSHKMAEKGCGFSDSNGPADSLCVRFDDPQDTCGGVTAYFAKDFEFIEDWSI